MRKLHESFPQPTDKSIKIWRYMDLAKFISLVQERKIYFPRADKLGDPFEGSVPRANHLNTQAIREIRKHPDLRSTMPHLDFYFDMTDEQFDQMIATMSFHTKQSLQSFFFSCWHMNDFESSAMWSLYGPKNSLCIQSTYESLERCLPDFIDIGVVKYIDYNRETIFQGNGYNNIMHKRKSFAHEHEARAVHWTMLSKELYDQDLLEFVGEGMKVDIDLDAFVEKIFISPEAPGWFKPLVEDLLSKYSLAKPVLGSELGEQPLY